MDGLEEEQEHSAISMWITLSSPTRDYGLQQSEPVGHRGCCQSEGLSPGTAFWDHSGQDCCCCCVVVVQPRPCYLCKGTHFRNFRALLVEF